MSQFPAKYDDDQRAAIVQTGVDRGVRPIRRIAEMAAAGELSYEGESIAPFKIPEPTVRDIIDRAKKRREGKLVTELAARPPRDAIEVMRRRFFSLADHELRRIEATHKRTKKPIDARLTAQLIRIVRETAALPGPGESRLPRKLGDRADDGGQPTTGPLENSLAQPILRAASSDAFIPTTEATTTRDETVDTVLGRSVDAMVAQSESHLSRT